MQFGDYLKRQRENKGWNQPEAAAKIEIEQSYLSKLETGKSYPSEEVFTRLIKAYEIDLTKLPELLTSRELVKLRDIQQIRALLLDREVKVRRASRGWLLGGLAMLMLGGGSLGLSSLAKDTSVTTFYYKSDGVLFEGEPIDTFDIAYRSFSGTTNLKAEFDARKSEITKRLDPVHISSAKYRGSGYLEALENGHRYFDNEGSKTTVQRSPLRWFFIPALAFLFGTVGCFFISFRWR